MSTITKKELIDRIAENSNTKQVVVKPVIHSFFDEVISELAKGNRFEFRDFGVFEVVTRAARVAQNPKTLKRVNILSKRVAKFKMGRLMKQKINGHMT